jgi:hypothetical protein
MSKTLVKKTPPLAGFFNRKFLTDLLGKIILDAHLIDLVDLGFDPIDVPLLVFEDPFK